VWVKALNVWIGKYEVTNQEYRRCVPDHRVGEYDGHRMDEDRQPVVRVDYFAVMAYLEWIKENCRGQVPAGCTIRLLNDRELSAMLRCGDDREYPWGSAWPPPESWNYHGEESAGPGIKMTEHRDKWPVTCMVDESAANDWGLHGVGGNVQEWTGTRKGSGKKGITYDLAGASWYFGGKEHLRCDYRFKMHPKYPSHYVGFRLVIGP
jgi:formylglycine-generating enzyme required for sulfatase activity